MEIHIDIQGAAELAFNFQAAPKIVTEELTKAVTEASQLLEREVKDATPIGASGGGGGLRDSIAAQDPKALQNTVIGVVATDKTYAEAVEFGTDPGRWVPIQPLIDWVNLSPKGNDLMSRFPSGTTPESVAYSVRHSIYEHGTNPQLMFTNAFRDNQRQVQAMFDKARDRIVRRMTETDDNLI